MRRSCRLRIARGGKEPPIVPAELAALRLVTNAPQLFEGWTRLTVLPPGDCRLPDTRERAKLGLGQTENRYADVAKGTHRSNVYAYV